MKQTKPSVLLVEDNADDRELAMLAFEEVGIRDRVGACEDAERALELFRKWETDPTGRPHRPSLVLIDIQLPGADGFQVLKAIRANPFTRFVPVVMLSSSSEESDIVKSYKMGANSYVRKPVDFARFVELARVFELYWLNLNDTPQNFA
jgi:two-component system response regulator